MKIHTVCSIHSHITINYLKRAIHYCALHGNQDHILSTNSKCGLDKDTYTCLENTSKCYKFHYTLINYYEGIVNVNATYYFEFQCTIYNLWSDRISAYFLLIKWLYNYCRNYLDNEHYQGFCYRRYQGTDVEWTQLLKTSDNHEIDQGRTGYSCSSQI